MTELEARDKCIGQEKCNDCGRYLDDCDGREDMIEEETICLHRTMEKVPIGLGGCKLVCLTCGEDITNKIMALIGATKEIEKCKKH